ncbi:MAG: enoyl-CoA hydratase/isomerase family protein [Pseudomonadota bacterium]
MPAISIETQDNIVTIRLTNGVTNAISPEMVSELDAALTETAIAAHGVVIAGGEKFFSMGFDLPRLIDMDRTGIGAFFTAFNDMLLRLFTLPVPTACAMTGHAVAGGYIIALGADVRIAAPKVKLGLNEIKLGLPVPYLADMILRLAAPDRVATEVLYLGNFMAAAEAAPLGLVDAVVSKETVETEAMNRISALTANSGPAFATMKAARNETVCRRYAQNGKAMADRWLDCWFSAPAQSLMRAAAEKF